ncbi:MAG: CRTAC1 family protein, partial [Planctomycetales bacterium]|nr:CRTAC1 family protein [Planctomycetales bacterium]
ERDDSGIPLPDQVDASRLKLYTREGVPAFREWLTIDHAVAGNRSGVQPVLVQDLNDDGLSEIVLVGANELMWNKGDGTFDTATVCDQLDAGFEVGLIADVTGDAVLDLVRPGAAGDLLLYVGNGTGRFSTPPLGRAQGGGPLRQPQVLAAGDIDRDGDLDLWIGQYKISYQNGQMPQPYYDANDGYPAYLLINEGNGRFTPSTEQAGLGEKQYRRSYGGAFVDLDEDGDLDLVVVSDFAGVDVYDNDGKGYFTDVTQQKVDERHLFGMSVTFGDYNVDGKLDFFATGMASTTARRLEYLKLGRSDRADVHMMRSRMGYGNRMFLAGEQGFAEPPFKDQVARTGWTWGATSFDFDNDRFADIFVANGHSSGRSTKDHCSHFWCHDIYDGQSEPNREVLEVFNDVMQGYFNRSESWDGYQKNALLVNLRGEQFVNLSFLMGVGHEFDGRAAISDDLDGDGRLDLIVVEDQWKDGQRLHVYRNELETGHHWIGVHLADVPGANSPLGCRVVLVETSGQRRIACVTAGDSIHAQHATTVHFGLGEQTEIQSLEVILPSGETVAVENPRVDAYQRVEIK